MADQLNYNNFNAVQLMLAAPEDVKRWSHGEVKKPETINYRTFKAEKDGLFCERIFGPMKDYECNCGRYKYPRHKGVVCERCGVEVTEREVRRERMGHIELAVPVAHIWYVRQPPSMIGQVLNLKRKYVEQVNYYASYIITEVTNNKIRCQGKRVAAHDVTFFNERKNISVIDAAVYNRLQNGLMRLADLYEDFKESLERGDMDFIKEFVRETYEEPLYGEQEKENAVSIYKVDKIQKIVNSYTQKLVQFDIALKDNIEFEIDKIRENEIENSDEGDARQIYSNLLDGYENSEYDNFEELIKTLKQVSSRDADKYNWELILEEVDDFIQNREKIKKNAIKKLKKVAKKVDKVIKEEPEFKGKIGGEAIYDLLVKVDIKKVAKKIRKDIESPKGGKGRKARLRRRLKIIEYFIDSDNEPQNMMLKNVPVIPPDLRPLVPLKGGKFASSDLNDLYRRIINRNNRLKNIMEMGAPDVMLHNEKRLLQESVDTLIQNGARNKTVRGAGRRPLKSLSENIKGKQGRFRRNLLGKRVDYSGRSVIVIGPHLNLNQCGIPKEMALELFKPFILRDLIKKGFSSNVRSARRRLEKQGPEVFDILEEIIQDHPVLLNRAPTLHRLGIQAFEPVLVEGKAIQLHPLVCPGFNADFDGDQMAVHVPISPEACMEAKMMLLSVNNIISPAHGNLIAKPSQDIVMGCNYLTRKKRGVPGEGLIFNGNQEVEHAYQCGKVDLHARIKVKGINKIREAEDWDKEDFEDPDVWEDYTTVGRVIFNSYLPESMEYVNKAITKKGLTELIENNFWENGKYSTVRLLDTVKKLGYKEATLGGVSLSMEDMHIPNKKQEVLDKAQKKVEKIKQNFQMGVITEDERYNNIVDIWSHVTDEVADQMLEEINEYDKRKYDEEGPKFNPIQLMASSGARGSLDQIRQLAGMRGLMSKPQIGKDEAGEVIEHPIKSNFREGLSVLEYYISTHGGRKGLTDTALKTAQAGHLTRRLIDVSHDVTIVEKDCGTAGGIDVRPIKDEETNEVIESFSERVQGRVSLDTIVDPITDEILVEDGKLIDREAAKKIEKSAITAITIRSPLTCESKDGVCSKCYGADLSTGKMVRPGLAVGIIAAQSIGEPGTQLTLRTFHVGGTASEVAQERDLTSPYDGEVRYDNIKTIENEDGDTLNIARKGKIEIKKEKGESNVYDIRYGAILHKDKGEKVKKGEKIAEWDPFSSPIIAEHSGKIEYKDIVPGINAKEEKNPKTGESEYVIVPYIGGGKKSRGGKKNYYPRIELNTDDGKTVRYPLQVDMLVTLKEENDVKKGDILARVPLKVIKTRDITGGLPRIVELFEARPPKNSAVVTEISGRVSIDQKKQGGKKSEAMVVKVDPEAENVAAREYKIPPGKHLEVYDGTMVDAGDTLTDGAVDPHDILRVGSHKNIQEFLVNELQSVYRLQGVALDDKHLEVVISQMLSFVQITDSGDTTFQEKEVLPSKIVERVNRKMEKQGKKPAAKKPKLLGISKASLNSESFISAASFERTTSVLTDAAAEGKVDYLKGLKENVIVGKLIPVGTGLFARREQENANN
ncbi:MAG: DNA-directed RNA polymerase subunit beta' [Elusimicrobiota bacterium]